SWSDDLGLDGQGCQGHRTLDVDGRTNRNMSSVGVPQDPLRFAGHEDRGRTAVQRVRRPRTPADFGREVTAVVETGEEGVGHSVTLRTFVRVGCRVAPIAADASPLEVGSEVT